jgi:hypothetical protein
MEAGCVLSDQVSKHSFEFIVTNCPASFFKNPNHEKYRRLA